MKVPLLDLKVQYAAIREAVRAGVDEVLDSQLCIGGPKIQELETRIAAYSDSKFAIGISSGTDAILASLMALGMGAGDEVITTPYTFFATAGCVRRVGARPVFVDIDPSTYNIRPDLIEPAITPQTRAVIPVHLYGQMADMDAIMAIAERHKLAVIEDAAQSIGATYKGHKAGSIGTTGIFSFYPTKNLGAAGDGGMIVTQDGELEEILRMLRNQGGRDKYYNELVGGTFRLDAIQAAVLLVKLDHIEEWHEGRRRNAAYYNERFASVSEITTPYVAPENTSIYNQYVVRVPERDSVRKALQKKDIGQEVYYPVPLHLQPCFADLGYKEGDFPESELAASETIALPIYPELADEQLDYVAKAVIEVVSG
ncbi:MAG: DegT/DnrJ/EryC1/StrS family aminotransferase [Phycisphaerae bacterium]|jgi:dTDP-4-amino-4,6-dideoxygalactose transaminase|nr:DegT/DnrJ/EryC1/StrS family aminotransferase [Phycisphaerae bacterium]